MSNYDNNYYDHNNDDNSRKDMFVCFRDMDDFSVKTYSPNCVIAC